jgi:deoxyribonuclease-4
MKLGCHVSIGKGLTNAVQDAILVKANTIQFFSRNPRGGKAKKLEAGDLEKARKLIQAYQIEPLVAHAPYTINFCSDKEHLRRFAVEVVTEDLGRMESCGCQYYVVHPGSHVNQGREKGIQLIAGAINSIFAAYRGSTMLLLETMAGQGSELGGNFHDLAAILAKLDEPERVGICIDTCHLFAGGYSVIRPEQLLDELEAGVSLEKVKVCHLNDSKMPEGSFKDRHETLGQGEIGFAPLIEVISHPRLKHLPFILETPGELEHYREEIAAIRAALAKTT